MDIADHGDDIADANDVLSVASPRRRACEGQNVIFIVQHHMTTDSASVNGDI